MKRISILLLFILSSLAPLFAADIPLWGLGITMLPKNLQIPPHYASQTEFVNKMAIVSYDDTTVVRENWYHEDGASHYAGGFLFSIGSAIPLPRIHLKNNEDVGIGLNAAWMVPFVTDTSWVAISMEFVVNLGVTVTPWPGISIGVSRKHICSHLLDRALFTSGDGYLGLSSSDTDPQHGPMAIRDSVIFSFHVAPEKLFGVKYKNLETSLYADYGYSLPGKDPLNDARYTRPSFRTSRYFNVGAQATHYFRYGKVDLGGVYAGMHLSFYENSGYTMNTGYSVGYILPFSVSGKTFRLDYSFYDGRAVMEEYYGHRERYTTIAFVFH